MTCRAVFRNPTNRAGRGCSSFAAVALFLPTRVSVHTHPGSDAFFGDFLCETQKGKDGCFREREKLSTYG